MNLHIKGKGDVVLNKKDFITKGGEGEIFGKGNDIYKIYIDPKKMIPNGKILELQNLKPKNVLKPIDTLFKKNTPVGFSMDWAKNTSPVCKLFTNDFRSRNNITPDMAIELMVNIKELMSKIHSVKCLIVDVNELNILVSNKNFSKPFFIDTDSYKTPSYPATAIMPNIRDYKSKIFSEETDWYSFAIISCQILIGIHPFKGKHPKYKKNQLIDRMKNNISIFNKSVSLPSVVRDFNCIPKNYLNWFIDLFEKGERKPPPGKTNNVGDINSKTTIIKSMCDFDISLVHTENEKILFFKRIGMSTVVKTSKWIIVDKVKYDCQEIVFTPKKLIPVLVSIENGKLVLKSKSKIKLLDLNCTDKIILNNTIYIVNNDKMVEISLNDGKNIIMAINKKWNIMPNSSQVLSGMIYQNVLGKPYIVIPKPNKCFMPYIKELEGYKIIDGKHDSQICMFIGFKNNSYDKIIIRFDEFYKKYNCRVIKDLDCINFIVLDNGVVVSINSDSNMEIFSNRLEYDKIKEVKSKNIKLDMKLFKDGISVLFAQDNKIYKIKMK